jgi:hypothetical protein
MRAVRLPDSASGSFGTPQKAQKILLNAPKAPHFQGIDHLSRLPFCGLGFLGRTAVCPFWEFCPNFIGITHEWYSQMIGWVLSCACFKYIEAVFAGNRLQDFCSSALEM